MSELWRFHNAVEHEPEIDAWLALHSEKLGGLARQWFDRMRRCGDDVRELMHDGCPVACAGDAAFAYVNVFKAHINVGFFFGAELPDPAGLLQGTGKRMRHVKLRPGAAIDSAALGALIAAAYDDIKRRLRQ